MKNDSKKNVVEVPEVVEDTTELDTIQQGNNLSLMDGDIAGYVQMANDLHHNIDRNVHQIHALQQCTISNALSLGHILTYIKENSKHGGWLKLFKGGRGKANSSPVMNFEFSDVTARRFMALYKNMEGRALAFGGEERRGQLMLQLQNYATNAGAIISVDDLTDSKTVANLYLELGILSKSKPAGAAKVPAAMQQAQKENLKRTEDDAMRAAAQIVTLANEYANFDASMCAKTFNSEIAAQLKEIAGRIAKAGKPSA